ncbi:phage baseplate protein [Fusobacterium hominis]|uniref:Phage baseplate protein n=1 Tax=Fusobacterium hominis TaxID=2764326 RepID=A0A7G9GXI9_9FUSO|nr:phage baseplate protein [Fusobacterium hominis]QNM15521.1 phage baseplate protein [Fusobacterium hominis]
MIGTLRGTIGIVHSVNTDNYTAKVSLPKYNNIITGDLQILSPLTKENQIIGIPKVNTPVLCIFLEDEKGIGYIIGSFFSDKNKSNSKQDELIVNFQNSVVTIKEDGNVIVTSNLTTINSDTVINGQLHVNKNVIVDKGITAEGIAASGSMTAGGEITAAKVSAEVLSGRVE